MLLMKKLTVVCALVALELMAMVGKLAKLADVEEVVLSVILKPNF